MDSWSSLERHQVDGYLVVKIILSGGIDAVNLKGLFGNSLQVSPAADISLMLSYKSPFMDFGLAFFTNEKRLLAAA